MIWQRDRWPNFKQSEFSCHGDGTCEMDTAFMDKLQELRRQFGKPMTISSGYRSPAYNDSVSDTGRYGPHTTGKACDVLIWGVDAYRILQLAMAMKFLGVGVNQRGEHKKRFLHLDMCLPPDFPRPAIWSY